MTIARNGRELAAILERDRAKLVVKYWFDPSARPDGIDSRSDRWYGDGSTWTPERVRAALDEVAVFGDKTRAKPKLEIATSGVSNRVSQPQKSHAESQNETPTVSPVSSAPWVTEGISRATYFRRKAEITAPSSAA